MSGDITRAPGTETAAIVQIIERMKPEIARALPKHLTPERLIRVVMSMFRKTPKLLSCDQKSLLAAIMELSQLGLEPNTPLGQAYIIPYGREATVIVGYRGLLNLASRANLIVSAECVYEKDEFSWSQGTHPRVHHVPSLEEDRGIIMKAYAVASWPDGRYLFKVIGKPEIDRAKASSASLRAGRDSPWITDEAAMIAKTAVRRLAPFLPMSAEMARAVELDEQAERGETQKFAPMGVVLDNVRLELEARADGLAAQLADSKMDQHSGATPPEGSTAADVLPESSGELPLSAPPAARQSKATNSGGDWPLKGTKH